MAKGSPSVSVQDDVQKAPKADHKRRYGLLLAVLLIVIIALALGLGLGLGLKKKHAMSSIGSSGSYSNTTSPSSGDSYASTDIQPLRKSTESYSLDFKSWDLNAAPTSRRYEFVVSEISAAPDGVNRTVLAINGQFPGPTIRANRGDRILVNLTNNMSNATTLHWHGMFQNGSNWMDGTTGITQCPIPPGRSFLYNFTAENQFGTYWYHAHFSTQYVDGIVGPLIIHAPEEAQTQKQYDIDQVILLQDWYHDLTSALTPQYFASGNENAEPVPDNGLLQGENYFNCSSYDSSSGYSCSQISTRPTFPVESNRRYRLRFINTGAFTPFQVSIDNHTLDIIEADGTLTSPLTIHRFEIAVAERYSVILHTNQSSSTNYWLRAQMNTNCYAADNPVLDPMVLGLITYTNTTTTPTMSADWSDALDGECQDLNNTLLVPTVVEQAPPADVLYGLSFSFSIGDYAIDHAIINGTSWTPSTENPTLNQAVSGLHVSNASFGTTGVVNSAFSQNQLVIAVPDFKVVDALVLNFDDGSHPFHLHGHQFWVMATSTEQYFPWETDLYTQINSPTTNAYTKNPMRRDTITIGAYQWVLIRFRNDNPGMWAFHCHNIWHMEAGLLMQFMALESVMKEWQLPGDLTGLCETS